MANGCAAKTGRPMPATSCGPRSKRSPPWASGSFADRARRELQATGQKVRTGAVDTRTELTPQEAQIAQLAREGRTNPEIGAQLFIGARTVEWHLRKVFAKLGISSRRELDEALRHPG
jgi:DNA-binding CsgD family transcriptional regulator